jgi:FKBP-type peptidyl-prolyl cis-trans isomerase FkpA
LRRASLAGFAALAALLVAACGYSDPYATQGQQATAVSGGGPSPSPGSQACLDLQGNTPLRFPDGLQVVDLTVGSGPTVGPTDTVQIKYVGYLKSDCSIFDSTQKEGGQPFKVALGKGNVIKGWDEGVPGMKVGGTRKLIIPAALGYGAQGSPPAIPPNATLVFDLDLVSSGPTPSPSPSAAATPRPTPT